jgi:YegS/Rv2252/BmrU family lipid kinase|tara:strand:+ start:253 stop:1146 length:894 start_codon:yes stop_codon:yes gene_type:complete
VKAKLIINPKAGIQKKKLENIKKQLLKIEKIEKTIEKFFKKHEITIDTEITKKAKDATKIAKNSKNYDLIIIAGGDGTINEVINGLENFKTKVGIIPFGSENIIAKELKLPLNIKKACETILKGKTKKIDLGEINKNKFVFVTGIGFDAEAIKNVKPELKEILGKHSYTIAALKTFFNYKPEKLTIKINKKEIKGYFIIASNVKRYGGNLNITPDAELDDGFLDLCIFKEKKPSTIIKYLIGATSGQIKRIKGLEHHKIKQAEIKSKNKVLYHTDAEIKGTTPVKIKVLPKKLLIIS